METKFTKGNWMVSCGDQIVSMPSQCKISNRISGWNDEEAIANADLISAAPDLLNEAIKIVENIKDYFSDVEDINSIIPINGLVNAINKATKQ